MTKLEFCIKRLNRAIRGIVKLLRRVGIETIFVQRPPSIVTNRVPLRG